MIALYARVSTEEQSEKYGLAVQLRELRAKVPDGTPAVEFVDDVSGTTLERPALTRLREAVRAKSIERVLVHDPDRLSRSLGHLLLLLEEFDKAGVPVEYCTMAPAATAEGRLFVNVKGVIAEYEREKIRQRTAGGRLERARRGLWVGGQTPFGYVRDPMHSGQLLILEEEARIIRQIFAWVAGEQRTLRSVAIALRRLALRPKRGGHWSPGGVRAILTNPVYNGTGFYGRRTRPSPSKAYTFRPAELWIPVPSPAIVSEETWRLAQAQLVANRLRFPGRPPTRFYLLRGLLRCGRCRRLYGPWGTTNYRCRGADTLAVRSCDGPRLPVEALDAAVWKAVEGVIRRPGVLIAATARYVASQHDVTKDLVRLEEALADAARREARLLDLYADGLLAKDVLSERLRAMRQQKDALIQERTLLEPRARVPDANRLDQWCRQARRGLARLTPDERRQVVRALVREAIVREDVVELQIIVPPGTGNRPMSSTTSNTFSATLAVPIGDLLPCR